MPLPDPIAVYLAGAFVGLALGPQLVDLAAKLIRSRSNEIVALVASRFLQALSDQSAIRQAARFTSSKGGTTT